jgi:hypothetical protein
MDAWSRLPCKAVIEDSDTLGYRLVADPLLDLMDVEDWQALERAALAPLRDRAA